MIASYGFSRCLQLISQLVLARVLSPREFGIWAMVLVLSNLSQIVGEAFIGQVLVQRGLQDRKLVDTVYSLGVNISIGLFIFQALAGWPLSRFFGQDLVWPLTMAAGVVFLLNAGSGTHNAVLQRQMKFREMVIVTNTTGLVKLWGVCLPALWGAGIWSFVIGEIVGAAHYAFWVRFYSGYRFNYSPLPAWRYVREVYQYILGIMGINLGVYANTTVDNLVLGKLFGPQALGYYNVAYQLAMLPFYTLSRSNQVNFSVLSRQDKHEQEVYVQGALEINAILSALVNGLAFIVAPWLIPLAYGEAWRDAVGLFQILLLYAYARGFMAILGTFLNAVNKPGLNAAINWALVALSIPAYVIGAHLKGSLGVAIAVAVVMGLVGTVWFWFVVCRTAAWPLPDLVRPVLIPTLAIAVALPITIAVPLPVPLSIVLQPLILIVGYTLLLILFSGGQFPPTLVKLVNRLQQRQQT
uniref:Polysaccharide biosynthesis protein n=1 Tax=Cyanothece sp. (strain PCC 7425 / ATCC 29141) TaxID=395961 RepID=B8HQ76_CYAP4